MMDQVNMKPEPTDAPTLLRDLAQHGTRLLRHEIELAKREVSHNLSRAGVGLALIAAALLMALVGFGTLAGALTAVLVDAGLPVSLSALIVGVSALVIAAIFVMIGKSRLNLKNLAPERSMESLRRDIKTLKETSHV